MPTQLIALGPRTPLTQNVEYALPTSSHYILGGAILEFSQTLGGTYSGLINSTVEPGVLINTSRFVRCTVAGPDVVAKKVTLNSGPYTSQVIQDGPSNYWKLDETSGLVAVDSISGINGTISGGVTLNQLGVIGKSMTFNGTSGKIVTTVGAALLTPFTIEMWIKRNSNIPTQVVFCNSWGAGDNLVLFVETNSLLAYTGPAGPSCNFPYDTNWHHIVFVAAGGVGGIFFIDGEQVESGGQTPITFTAGVAKSFEFGFDPNWTYFNGSLDEFVIYPRALSALEIAAHSNAR